MSKTHDVPSLTNSVFQVVAKELAKNGINVYGTDSTKIRGLLEEAVVASITNVSYVGDDRITSVEFFPTPSKKPTVDETIRTFREYMDKNEFTEEERYETTAQLYLDEVSTEDDFHG